MKNVYIVVCYDYVEEREINQRAFLSEDTAYANLVEQLQKYDRARYDFHVEEVVIADWPNKRIQNSNARHHLISMIKDEARWNDDYEPNEEAKEAFNKVCRDILKEYVGGETDG